MWLNYNITTKIIYTYLLYVYVVYEKKNMIDYTSYLLFVWVYVMSSTRHIPTVNYIRCTHVDVCGFNF